MKRNESHKLLDDTQNKIIDIIQDKLAEEGVEAENYYFKEGDFADILGVGRSTVREAIRSLEVRGYVERCHGKGVRAIDRSVEAVTISINDLLMRSGFDYMDIFEFRNMVEVEAAGMAAARRSDDNLAKMRNYIEIMNNKDSSYDEYQDADFLFHEEIINATGNKLLLAMINAYGKIIRYVIELSTAETYRPEVDENFHENIYQAVLNRDVENAKKSMEEHLVASEENVANLKKIEGVNW